MDTTQCFINETPDLSPRDAVGGGEGGGCISDMQSKNLQQLHDPILSIWVNIFLEIPVRIS